MPSDLAAKLRDHLESDALLKGWEVDKRTVVGAKRQGLRKAAREAKRLAVNDWNAKRQQAIESLLSELATAGEADFDGLLAEALEALATQPVPEKDDTKHAAVIRAAEDHLLRGDRAKKSKRDYAKAAKMAEGTRAAAREYAAAMAHAHKTRASYVASVEMLRGELELIGEADFDGLLRTAVATLKTCDASPLKHVSTETPRVDPTPATVAVELGARDVDTTIPVSACPAPWPAPTLEVAEVDAGCVWLGTLPADLQAALLRDAFPVGTRGVCGGLVEGERVRGAHGEFFEPTGVANVSYPDLGLHGCHLVACDEVALPRESAVTAVLEAIRAVAPQLPATTRAALDAFDMTSLRLSFETMGGRTIPGTNGTLCGWSADKLRANGTDGCLKVIVLLGAAEVRESF